MKTYRKRGLWLLIPGLSGFVFFYIIPLFFSLYYSAIDNTFSKKFVGLSNYITVLGNKYFRLALRNSFEFTIIGVPLLIIFSFIIAVLLASSKGRITEISRPMYVIPVLLPSAAVILIWQTIFNDNGAIFNTINNFGAMLGIKLSYKIPIYAMFIWKNTGYNVVLFMSGLMSIPQDIFEASSIDGASFWRKHIYITFPLLLPTTFFVLILSIVNSFKIFKEVYLYFGTSYPDESIYILQHYMNNHFNKLNYQFLTAGAIIFAVIVYLFVTIGYKVENSKNREVW